MVEHSTDIISVMTYNIHSGVNRDGNVRLQPVVQVIRELNPDIVALQEVDMGITHRRYRHQAKVLSERLEMEFFFYPLVQFETRHYGLAFLSRHPFTIVKCDRLPTVLPRFRLQKRGAIRIRKNHLPRPILQIDHIFVSNHLTPLSVKVPTSRSAQMASDHLPLLAELQINPQQ